MWTCSLVWLACLGECCVGIAGHVHSTKVLHGHSEDTMSATTKQSTAAGLPVPTSHYKSVLVNFSHALFSCLSTYDDLTMQALVWLCIIQFGSSYANFRPYIFKHQICGKKPFPCIQVNMVVQQVFMCVSFHKHCRR